MRGFGSLLVVAGVVSLALGGYGFLSLSNAGVSGDVADWAISAFNSLGIAGSLSDTQSFTLFLVQNRVLLSIAGAAGVVLGGLLRRKAA